MPAAGEYFPAAVFDFLAVDLHRALLDHAMGVGGAAGEGRLLQDIGQGQGTARGLDRHFRDIVRQLAPAKAGDEIVLRPFEHGGAVKTLDDLGSEVPLDVPRVGLPGIGRAPV